MAGPYPAARARHGPRPFDAGAAARRARRERGRDRPWGAARAARGARGRRGAGAGGRVFAAVAGARAVVGAGRRTPVRPPAGHHGRRTRLPARRRNRVLVRPGRLSVRESSVPEYAELHAHSWYSFLDGVDAPAALVEEAVRQGLAGLAITDHDSMAAAPHLAVAARGTGLATVFGAELNLGLDGERTGVPDPAGAHLLVLARDPDGYRRLAGAITRGHLAGDGKGRPVYDLEQVAASAGGHWEILTGCRKAAVPRALAEGGVEAAERELRALMELFEPEHVHVELHATGMPGDDRRNDQLAQVAARLGLPTVATGLVHYARPDGHATYAAVAALRARATLEEIDSWLPPGPGMFLRSPGQAVRRFRRYPGAVAHAVDLARDCRIDFDTEIRPRPPRFSVPDGHDEDTYLRELTFQGIVRRYGTRAARPDAHAQAEHELGVIKALGFSGWFLISWDVVRFARDQTPPILVQGRGSAANSIVVHALGISAVDPIKYQLLFSRFLHPERDGPPDIDLDIQADRREEVLQYVYAKHGRENAAMVANEVCLTSKFSVREAARILGYSPGTVDAISSLVDRHDPIPQAHAEIPDQVLSLARRLEGRPRHFSIHSGGIVICEGPIAEVLPVEWARMPGRSVIQGDKEAAVDSGLVKHDLLSLRTLSAAADVLTMLAAAGTPMEFADIPADDPLVYDMINDGDTVGVFQVESRAQISVAPVMKARTFRDLAVQIALIRPGPGASGASRRYLRRRSGQDSVPAIHPVIDQILAVSNGTVLFQEQAMMLAIEGAGFTPAEADRLRRAMGAKRSLPGILALRERFLAGLDRLGLPTETAEDLYQQIESFSGYGFPFSHSLSFAFIAAATAWMKRYHPAMLLTGILNHMPMGFYETSTLIADAQRHQVTVRPVHINASRATTALEPLTETDRAAYRPVHRHASPHPQPPVRLGLITVRGMGTELAETIEAEREADGPYADLEDLVRRTRTPTPVLENLAAAGALD
ncbi:DNA polymerase III subunit alpha, partial [Actinospica durhamensis]|nr:DNA polymerase III subunit alpha [Actinospica durhamensis]